MTSKPGAWLIYLAAALLVCAGLGVIAGAEADYRRQVDEETQAKARILAANVAAALDFGNVRAAREAVDAFRANGALRSALVLDTQGRTFAAFRRSEAADPDASALSTARVPITAGGETIGQAVVTVDRNPLSQRLSRYSIIALLLTLAALLVFVFGRAQASERRANQTLRAQAEALSATNAALTAQIAQREQAEGAQRAADALYRAYFEHTNEYLFVIEVMPDGRFVYRSTNPACAESGFTTALVAGKSPEEVFEPVTAAEVSANYRRCVETGKAQHYSETLALPAGVRAFETVLVPISVSGRRVDRIMGSGRDVTERLRLEDALRQSQKMEAIGQLTGGIAHDFNNILGALVGALELIGRKANDPERVRRLATAGITAAERGARLTSQLLTFSRRQRLQLQPVNISATLCKLNALLETTVGSAVELRYDLHDGATSVLTEPTQLEMAILNLCLNARDAMPGGGSLTLATALRELRGDPDLSDGAYVELQVRDTGTGMSEEVIARALEPFFTTKELGKGTGLGLSQAFGLAKLSGGTLRIASTPGVGTTISLLLGRSTAAAPTEAGEALPDEVPIGDARPARVLLVDDDDAVRAVVAEALETIGLRVVQAASGAAALEQLRSLAVDVLVADYAMPQMNGAELARAARAVSPELPIVLISGFSDTTVIEESAGPSAVVLRKPFRVDQLAALIRSELQAQPASAPRGEQEV